MHRGRLLRTVRDAVEILDVDGVEPVVLARHSVGDPYPRTIGVHGDIAVIGGSALVVLDLADPMRPHEVARAATPVGDVRALASDGTHAFASSGNGLVPIALRCE